MHVRHRHTLLPRRVNPTCSTSKDDQLKKLRGKQHSIAAVAASSSLLTLTQDLSQQGVVPLVCLNDLRTYALAECASQEIAALGGRLLKCGV